MKYLITFTTLGVVLNYNAQIRNYYLETSVLKPQPAKVYSTSEKVEFTGNSLSPVKSHFRSFLQEKLTYERNGFQVSKLNDSVVLYKERYITKNDNEINPKSGFLDVEYKLHLTKYDSVIEKVDLTGSENMVGEVFKKYWNVEVNLLENAEKRVVASSTHQNDSVQLIQTKETTKQGIIRNYFVQVSDKNDNIENVISGTKKMIIDANLEKERFFAERRQKTYQLKKESEVKYSAYKTSISTVLTQVLHNETNLTGNVSVVLKADTLGRTWVEVFGKNARVNSALRQNLMSMRYDNITEKGFYMTTVDTFYYDYSSLFEQVDMRKNMAGIHFRTSNFEVIEQAARAEAERTPVSKADLKYDVNYVEVNGAKNSRVINTSTVERMTGGQVMLGIIGGIGSLILWVISDEE